MNVVKIFLIAAQLCVVLAIIWWVNSCSERAENFKLECMRTGGSVISTPSQDMCLKGTATFR